MWRKKRSISIGSEFMANHNKETSVREICSRNSSFVYDTSTTASAITGTHTVAQYMNTRWDMNTTYIRRGSKRHGAKDSLL